MAENKDADSPGENPQKPRIIRMSTAGYFVPNSDPDYSGPSVWDDSTVFPPEPPVIIELYHDRPAEQFERPLGLTGISRIYVIPPEVIDPQHRTDDNLKNAIQLEHWVLTGSPDPQTLSATLTAIIGKNSELSQLHYDADDVAQLRDLLSGIASGFNPKDLQYWRDFNHGPDRATLWAGEFRLSERRKKVSAKTGQQIEWVTSPDTRDNIDWQLGIDPNAPASYSDIVRDNPEGPESPGDL